MHGAIDELTRDDFSTAWTARATRSGRRLFFFCPDVTDASTLKRAQQFIDHGYGVTVFGFRRARYNMGYKPTWPHVPLGHTADGKYWHRIRALLGALPTIFAHRFLFKGASVFYARNIDQLLLALLARLLVLSKVPIAYEVLDIPPILMRRGLGATLLRAIERFCLRYVKVLVLSSPGFHRGYYAAVQKYRGPWFLLENKLHPSIARTDRPAPPSRAQQSQRPWVVGYFGLIRGEQTFELMTRLAQRLEGRVVFKFRGVLTTVDPARFDTVMKRMPNMQFGGPYLPHQDLEALYREVDFAWALDLEHTDHNSRWLLPCRFYEAGYFGVPCLAVHGFEVGSVLERYRIGFTFAPPLEDQLVGFFETLTPADYDHIRHRLSAVPTSMFVADNDIDRLCTMLDEVRPQRG
jgi:succinoglycan biosynthesis protein ExoL